MPLWTKVNGSTDMEGIDAIDLQTAPSFVVSPRKLALLKTPKVSELRVPSTGEGGNFYSPKGAFLVETELPPVLNKNTEWVSYPGFWSTYLLVIFAGWLVVLSFLRCGPGMAWSIVHIAHAVVSFYIYHWQKGVPFNEGQGAYDKMTWWEQMDDGRQLTPNRKLLTAVPVILYIVAIKTLPASEYTDLLFVLNTIAVFTSVIAKLPLLHLVRIFGINA